MKKTSKRGHSTMSELNITPLLDLVFVLLVIFIITTPAVGEQSGDDAAFRQAAAAEPNEPSRNSICILVDDNGQAFLNGAAYTTAGLKAELSQMKDADPENMAVVVKGSDVVEYQGMVNVLDVLPAA